MATTRQDLFNNIGNSVDPLDDKKMTDGSLATWSAGVPFKRASAVPLDKYTIFPDKTAAETFALKNPVAYPGQIVCVVNAAGSGETYGKVTSYVINQDGTLQELPDSNLVIPKSDLQTSLNDEEKPVSSKAVKTAIGQIDTLLDQLNGEVIN